MPEPRGALEGLLSGKNVPAFFAGPPEGRDLAFFFGFFFS